MLLQIKGRRYCQTRLVEPYIDSLNNNDCFILITKNRLFLWLGENANIIEKSKANEIYEWIRLRKDMGIHKTQTMSHIVDNKSGEIDLRKHPYLESNLLSSHTNEFLELLTKNRFNVETLNEFDNFIEMPDEDEKYESLINETNMIYKVVSKIDQDINSSSNSDENSDDSDESDANKFSLELLNNSSGSNLLSYNMLDEDSVFIFDFGSELYLWSGRNANNKLKKAGLILAKNLYDNGYDYSNFKITPLKYQLNFVLKSDNLKSSTYFKSNMTRPKWTIFGKQVQNAETVLFREKFIDWPNQTNSPSLKKVSYVNNKTIDSNVNSNNYRLPLTPFRTPLTNRLQANFLNSNSNSNSKIAQSPSLMTKEIFNYQPLTVDILKKLINNKHEENPVNLILENTNLGRGRFWFDEIENRKFQILTEKVDMFKIIENEMIQCDSQEFGELSSNYTYVIKWHYKVNSVGFRSLKGEASRHNNITGRDRYALFFWQGENSSINEKGASALLSLDFGGANLATSLGANFNSTDDQQNNDNLISGEKKSLPHVQIFQYKETAAFCQLFDGSMLILTNNNLICDNEWQMFELRGELKEESHLIELKCVLPENLRSKTSFLFLNKQANMMIVWHGCCSSEIQKELIVECAKNFKNRLSNRFPFKKLDLDIKEIQEGSDKELYYLKMIFKSESELNIRPKYQSLLNENKNEIANFTPRLYLMTCLFGNFEVKEILNPLRSDHLCPFPFQQFHLYEEKQPSLFLIDNKTELYIWQGWFDKSENESETTNDSTKIRYTLSRKCAYETAINYWKAKYPNENIEFKGYVVYAGLEPIEFINLFPNWKINENARNCNLNDGKELNQKDNIETLIGEMSRDTYPLSILRQKPLPDGVNPLKLECYLTDEEFEEVLKLTKEEFFSLPAWKQTNLKKKVNLF